MMDKYVHLIIYLRVYKKIKIFKDILDILKTI
jgi:hypothetical protein